MPRYGRSIGVVLGLSLALMACGDDAVDRDGDTCPEGQRLNPITGECAPVNTDNLGPGPDEGEDLGDGDDEEEPGDPDTPGDGDGGQDPGDGEDPVDPGPPNPLPPENFCGGANSAGLDCTFYAHTTSTLYRIDPFARTLQTVGPLPTTLFDIDTHPDGVLYGITTTTLYKLEPGQTQWQTVGSIGSIGNANGLCIDSTGKAYITASNSLYTVDLRTAQASRVGSMGTHTSSGDCVINKADTLYMTASGLGQDSLVLIDGDTAQTRRIGATGFSEIYALTAAWGYLFGLTGRGQLISLDPQTGRGQLLHTFSGKTFYGAASTPGR
jgi:hypothetical protein